MACQEIYDPELDPGRDNIPVIQGVIHNAGGSSNVQVNISQPFGSRYKPSVMDAMVTIAGSDKEHCIFTHSNYGKYLPVHDNFSGTPGQKYILKVEMNNGEVYESYPTVIPSPPIFDSLFAEIGSKDIILHNVYGDLMIKEVQGLQVFMNIESDADSLQYYRVTTTTITLYKFYWYKSEIETVPVYIWNISDYMSIPNLATTTEFGNRQIVKKKKAGFLEYHFDPSTATDTSSSINPMGWITIHKCYSIDKATYQYYEAVNEQLSAGDRIFDPIPSEVEGNIHCTSDPDKKVFGIFEASSVNEVTNGFFWTTGKKSFQQKILDEYTPPASSGRSIGIKPDFWVDF